MFFFLYKKTKCFFNVCKSKVECLKNIWLDEKIYFLPCQSDMQNLLFFNFFKCMFNGKSKHVSMFSSRESLKRDFLVQNMEQSYYVLMPSVYVDDPVSTVQNQADETNSAMFRTSFSKSPSHLPTDVWKEQSNLYVREFAHWDSFLISCSRQIWSQSMTKHRVDGNEEHTGSIPALPRVWSRNIPGFNSQHNVWLMSSEQPLSGRSSAMPFLGNWWDNSRPHTAHSGRTARLILWLHPFLLKRFFMKTRWKNTFIEMLNSSANFPLTIQDYRPRVVYMTVLSNQTKEWKVQVNSAHSDVNAFPALIAQNRPTSQQDM